MNKIASFTVNHLDLLTGVYVSRKDYIGDVCLTTFDLRFTRPNEEPRVCRYSSMRIRFASFVFM